VSPIYGITSREQIERIELSKNPLRELSNRRALSAITQLENLLSIPRITSNRDRWIYLAIVRADTYLFSDLQKLISPKVLRKLQNGRKFFDSI